MLNNLIRWFKFKIFNQYNNELNSRYFHNDYRRRNYGNRNSYSSELQIPKTALQIAEAEFFSNQLRQNQEHYDTLRDSILDPLLNYHTLISQDIFWPNLNSWDSFQIHYYISNIKNSSLYPNAERHLRMNIANYDSILTRIETEINSLNSLVSNTKTKIKDKVRNILSDFALIELDGQLTILALLEDYWFNRVLRIYLTERKWYKDIISAIQPFDSKLKTENGMLMYGARAVANLPIDQNKFIENIMELVTDYEVFDLLLDLQRKREQIGDIINDFTRQLANIIKEIDSESYRTLTNCCPSQQVAAIS